MSRKAELFIEASHRLGESIIWHEANRRLYWIDLLDPALFEHDLNSGKTVSRPLPLPPPIGAIVATEDPGRLLLIHRDGLSLLALSGLSLEAFCNPEQGRDAIIWNDAKCDRWGRVWAGSSHAFEKEARGALWCVKDRGTFALGDAGFAISNGPAFSPDGRTMYFNDSVGRITFAYDVSEDGLHPRNRRPLIHYASDEGVPDGLVTDSDGCLWIAHWGGACVSRYSPNGRCIARFPLPAQNVTTLCFAGPDFSTLYITTARDGMDEHSLATMPLSGSLFRLETEAKGLVEPLLKLG